jgi:sugar lactone lactonase YvrE
MLKGLAAAAALALCWPHTAFSQTAPVYAITTVARTGIYPFSGQGQNAQGVLLFNPNGIALNSSGTVYFSESYYQRVFKITSAVTLVTVDGVTIAVQ